MCSFDCRLHTCFVEEVLVTTTTIKASTWVRLLKRGQEGNSLLKAETIRVCCAPMFGMPTKAPQVLSKIIHIVDGAFCFGEEEVARIRDVENAGGWREGHPRVFEPSSAFWREHWIDAPEPLVEQEPLPVTLSFAIEARGCTLAAEDNDDESVKIFMSTGDAKTTGARDEANDKWSWVERDDNEDSIWLETAVRAQRQFCYITHLCHGCVECTLVECRVEAGCIKLLKRSADPAKTRISASHGLNNRPLAIYGYDLVKQLSAKPCAQLGSATAEYLHTRCSRAKLKSWGMPTKARRPLGMSWRRSGARVSTPASHSKIPSTLRVSFINVTGFQRHVLRPANSKRRFEKPSKLSYSKHTTAPR